MTCLAYNKEEHQVIRLNVGKEPDYCEEGPGFQWARPEEHCYLEEFVSESTNNDPLIDISLYSHHLSAWYCIDIVRHNSFLVTHGSGRV